MYPRASGSRGIRTCRIRAGRAPGAAGRFRREGLPRRRERAHGLRVPCAGRGAAEAERMRQTLDEVVMDDVELDDAMPEERGVWKTELGILAEDAYRAAYNAVKGTARFCGFAALHLVGGGLSASLQHRLEERLNSKKHKVYSAETATWANLVVTKPLFYGALTAYLTQHAGYSPWWGVAGVLAGLV